MKNWKVRGLKQGQKVDITVRAQDWTAAVDAGRAAPHQLEVQYVTLVDLPEVLMARLHHQHGYRPDRLMPTFATKEFKTAVGWKQAVVRVVVPDGLGQIWLLANYQSEGRNVLANTMAVIPQDSDQDTINAHIEKFSNDIDNAVVESYAGRLLAA